MDETTAMQSLEAALKSVQDLKEEYIAIQDFDNAAKWRDIGDAIKKSILMTKRPVK
jgi:hypothetical protein